MSDSNKFYTGIGHRDTPLKVKSYIKQIAKRLSLVEYTLRSGGADGADSFFEEGVIGKRKEIYLPWKRFNNNYSPLYDIGEKAYNKVEQYFNEWSLSKTEFKDIKDGAKKLFIRNYYQLVGYDDIKSDFVIYYADQDNSGKPMGGTGFAVYMANKLNIPSYNIKTESGIHEVNKLLLKLKIDYMYIMLRHYFLFYEKQIDEKDDERIDQLVNLKKNVFYKNIDLRKILENYFIKYHKRLKNYKDNIDNFN